jgi:hypothetical protein
MINSTTHTVIATTLRMIVTFALYCILEDTRASALLFQDILVYETRDQILYTRCWWTNKNGMFPHKLSSILEHSILINRTCEYFSIRFGLQRKSSHIRPIIVTIISSWLVGRLWNGVDLWYKVDIITIYFLLRQVMFVVAKSELKQLPMVPFTFYQGWLYVLMAFGAFTVYGAIFRYLAIQVRFVFL